MWETIRCDREACNNFNHGLCTALNDTDFGGKVCPFFKSKADTKPKDREFHVRGKDDVRP